MRMSLLTKAPLSLARATISTFTPLDPAAGSAKMTSNTRQNVTWVEVRFQDTTILAWHLTIAGCSRSRFILGRRHTFMPGVGLQPMVAAR